MIVAAAAIALAACADADALKRASDVGVATAPSVEWKPAPSEVPSSPKASALDVPDSLRQPGAVVTLAQAIDVALRNNPATRAAWMHAKAAEDEVGSRRAAYWPEIDINAQVLRQKSPNTGQRVPEAQTSGAPSIALNYLLFDFGGRSSQMEQARADLIAADFAHNATIQNVVLRVAQAYYDYLNSTSLLDAQRSTLAEMQANYEAAEARHNAGVATIADVLQAKTALSQAQLAILSLEGDVKIVQGALATAAGLPPTALFDVGVLPVEIPTKEISRQVDELIARAEADRPDLLSMRARAESAHARIAEMKSEGLPIVSLSASAARNYYGGSIGDSNSYLAGVQVRFPAFTGWRNTYDVRQAEAEAAAADAEALTFQQQIDLQVWTSYYGKSSPHPV